MDTFYVRNATVVGAAAAPAYRPYKKKIKILKLNVNSADLCDLIQPYSLFLLTFVVCALFGVVQILFIVLFVHFFN